MAGLHGRGLYFPGTGLSARCAVPAVSRGGSGFAAPAFFFLNCSVSRSMESRSRQGPADPPDPCRWSDPEPERRPGYAVYISYPVSSEFFKAMY